MSNTYTQVVVRVIARGSGLVGAHYITLKEPISDDQLLTALDQETNFLVVHSPDSAHVFNVAQVESIVFRKDDDE